MHNLIIVNIIIKLKTLFVTQSHPLFKGQNVASEQLQTIPALTFGISSSATAFHKKKRSNTAFNFLVIYLPMFSFIDQEGIAEAIRFGTTRKIIELLGSATLKEIGSIWGTGVEDDIEKLKNTVSTNTLYFTTSESYILPISHNTLKK